MGGIYGDNYFGANGYMELCPSPALLGSVYETYALSINALLCLYSSLCWPHHFHHYNPGLNRHGHDFGFLKVA